jgi:hypothetical protein
MCISCILWIMAVHIGWRRMGKAVVDCRRRCDWIEELVYVCSLMCERVVQCPTHRCCDEGVGRGLAKQGEGQWVGGNGH